MEAFNPIDDVKNVQLFEYTRKVDGRGIFVSKSRALAIVRFSSIVLDELADFNHQNVVYSFDVKKPRKERRFSVKIPTSHGCDAYFECDEIEIVSAQPYNAEPSTNA